jgi:hypothetical protein
MLCIAAFIVFGILAIFSATFRPLAAKAWRCVVLRVTLRPCDVNFGEEIKTRMVAKLMFRAPRTARFIDRWMEAFAFVFVALSIWSLVYVFVGGLNLYVYGTCSPNSVESCSLSGEACGVDQAQLSLMDAIRTNAVGEWALGPFTRLAETISRIPDRLRHWEAKEFLGPTATFAQDEDAAKPYAVEVIDPSCKFCRQLTANMKEAGIPAAYNVSFLLYPIPLPDGKTKFPHSRLMASYIEALKTQPQTPGAPAHADWVLLSKIFEGDLQQRFVLTFNAAQAEEQLQSLLKTMGYTPSQIRTVALRAHSSAVEHSIAEQKLIVEERVRTIRIPTLLIAGRRYDRALDAYALKRLLP